MTRLDLLAPINDLLALDEHWPKLAVYDNPFVLVRDRAYFAEELVVIPWPTDSFVNGESRPAEFRIERRKSAFGWRYEMNSYVEPEEDGDDGHYVEDVDTSTNIVCCVSHVVVLDGPDDDAPTYNENITVDGAIDHLNELVGKFKDVKATPGLGRTMASRYLAEASPRVWLATVERADLNEIALQWIAHSTSWVPLLARIAANPATAGEELVRLSHIVPEVVVDNPALALHVLVAPDDFAELHPQAQQAYRNRFGEPTP